MLENGPEALGWAASLPDGAPRAEALKQFTYTWSQHDSKQTSAWLDSIPPGPSRSAATEGFVFAVIDTDPDAALSWTRSISDERARLDILRRAWRQWSRNNSKSAEDWLANGPVSDAERMAIEESPPAEP